METKANAPISRQEILVWVCSKWVVREREREDGRECFLLLCLLTKKGKWSSGHCRTDHGKLTFIQSPKILDQLESPRWGMMWSQSKSVLNCLELAFMLYNLTLSHVSRAAHSHSLPTFPVNQPWNTAVNTGALSLSDQLSKTIWRWDRVTGIFKSSPWNSNVSQTNELCVWESNAPTNLFFNLISQAIFLVLETQMRQDKYLMIQ